MDLTVYLPDELKPLVDRARQERGLLSQLLRDALVEEMERRDTVSKTLDEVETYEVYVDEDDGGYTGRITGKRIAYDEVGSRDPVEVFLTEDERVLLYDGNTQRLHDLEDVADVDGFLREWLSNSAYSDAMRALGETPVIDV